MKHGMSIILLLLLPLAVSAQVSVSAGVSFGTFRMEQLRQYSKDLQVVTPVTMKTFGNYGPFIGYEASAKYDFADQHHLSLTGGLISTGSLTTRTDYSGSINYRHTVSAKMIAIQYDWAFPTESKLSVAPSVRVGALFTKYHFQYEIKLNDSESPPAQELDFNATSLMASPGMVFRYKLTGALFATADLRYLLDLKAELRYDQDDSVRLVDSQNLPTSPDWSGFRGTLSVGYRFNFTE